MTSGIDADGDAPHDIASVDTPTDLDGLADALDTLFAVQRDFFADVAERLDLLEIDVRAMLYVSRREQVSPKTLARHLRLTGGGATTVVDRLKVRGYLARTPNLADRRSLFIVPTPTGSRAADAIRTTFSIELAGAVPDRRDRVRIMNMVRRLNRRIGASTDVTRDRFDD